MCIYDWGWIEGMGWIEGLKGIRVGVKDANPNLHPNTSQGCTAQSHNPNPNPSQGCTARASDSVSCGARPDSNSNPNLRLCVMWRQEEFGCEGHVDAAHQSERCPDACQLEHGQGLGKRARLGSGQEGTMRVWARGHVIRV